MAVIVDAADAVASSSVGRWAARELVSALALRGLATAIYPQAKNVPAAHLRVFACGLASPGATAALASAGMHPAAQPEALALCQTRDGVWACGHDARGLSYALLELADRVRLADDPVAALAVPRPIVEKPANRVRSIMRLFTSDVEDKPWFNDREMWPRISRCWRRSASTASTSRSASATTSCNRVTDAYFLFSYPFLLAVPGYDVRVPQLPDAERDRNLEMLRFIARETTARGLRVPARAVDARLRRGTTARTRTSTIEGLTAETHGPYCRDAVRLLLQQVPEISGVTFRVHGESGVDEGSYEFWKTVFDGVATCGRKRRDRHALQGHGPDA